MNILRDIRDVPKKFPPPTTAHLDRTAGVLGSTQRYSDQVLYDNNLSPRDRLLAHNMAEDRYRNLLEQAKRPLPVFPRPRRRPVSPPLPPFPPQAPLPQLQLAEGARLPLPEGARLPLAMPPGAHFYVPSRSPTPDSENNDAVDARQMQVATPLRNRTRALVENVVKFLPDRQQAQARNILEYVTSRGDVTVSNELELVVDGRAIPESNIVDILKWYTTNTNPGRLTGEMRGVSDLAEVMRATNMPSTFIANGQRRQKITRRAVEGSPYRTPIHNRKERGNWAEF